MVLHQIEHQSPSVDVVSLLALDDFTSDRNDSMDNSFARPPELIPFASQEAYMNTQKQTDTTIHDDGGYLAGATAETMRPTIAASKPAAD